MFTTIPSKTSLTVSRKLDTNNMNIKNIGLSTSAFGYTMGATGKNTDRKNPNPWTLEQFIGFAAEQGFGGIEVPLMRFIPDLEPNRVAQIQAQLEEKGMFFLMDAETALDVDQITTLIPLAKKFGSPIIRIKSSTILGCDRKKLGRPWADHVGHCIAVLRELAPKLREEGVRIAVENHQDLDSSDLLQIVDAVGADVVGVNFDIGNAFSTCEDPIVFARRTGPYISNIHLKDYKIFRTDEGFRLVRCPLGEGSVDFRAILPLLTRNSPDAKMVVELGALEARNVASGTADFWKEIQPRDDGERRAFAQLLEREGISVSDDSWKTPWERGAPASAVTSYERSELETSKRHLSSL